ncbi:MurR/RpiR family transcriptional regulator [Fusibacter sp. 3D3]|uniref:MurR/RpiR family transcriptional regulator n=1 Tax=Fusibacter sp. 3D3 TaxID=1048380 RepID=UPI00085310E1|nr:MurR/RpiR family transcriptional regulator [Fusibacter sp. 3D3]GAU79241.1 transcriptional regulator [Fusibacter sp. 3D3]
MNIVDNIKAQYDNMTRKQMELADFMLSDPNIMCFITLKELCLATKISEVTVLNACMAWGYDNYNDLKSAFRNYMSEYGKNLVECENAYSAPRVPRSELGNKSRYLMDILDREVSLLNEFGKSFDPEYYLEAAKVILDHKDIIICGRGISLQLAETISIRLATIGVSSVLVNTELNDSVHSALPMLCSKTLIISISFPDYYFVTSKFTEYAAMKKATIIAITDSEDSEISKMSNISLFTSSATPLFLNTLSAPMMLVNLLTSAVSIELNASRRKRRKSSDEYSSLFTR